MTTVQKTFRISSVPSPLDWACKSSKKNFIPRNALASPSALLNLPEIRSAKLSPLVSWIASFCILNACRISELLQVSFADVIHPDRILLTGAKGSRSYVLACPGVSDYVSASTDCDASTKLWSISYIAIYRALRKANIYLDIEGHLNKAVLHSGRYLLARSVNTRIGIKGAGECLRHNSNKAILYYTGCERC
jgi:hypothetical protein